MGSWPYNNASAVHKWEPETGSSTIINKRVIVVVREDFVARRVRCGEGAWWRNVINPGTGTESEAQGSTIGRGAD